MGPSPAAGRMLHSNSSPGLFFQGDMQSQGVGNVQLGSFGNNVMNNVASSGPSIGASSMVTDANSGLAGGGPHLQRSTSINNESYARLPTSPLSFSSNNLSISGSSIIDGASDNISHLQKKPRLDVKQEDMMPQQVVQQLMQRQDSMQLQSPNPQLQALIQQQRLRQQQQLLQSLPPVQRAHLLQQQQQQLQLRQLQQQGLQPTSGVKRPYDGGVCSRRLNQYLYHQRQRPPDNSIAYWRKFVAEYYSPRAKKRWCLSQYDNVGHHSLGVFPQAAVDSWQCDICGSKSGRGFEATFEVLPRLNEIKFSSGVMDELLFLDLPRESRFPSGIMILEYGKAVQETIYEQLRVVRQGQLKVIFTPDLKILTWEFCARRHEELIPRRLVAPQVSQLVQVAQKCQSTIAEGRSEGVPQQDLQTNSTLVVTAWRQLARSLELQSLNDLGFSKRYVRCLQISEVVSSMKDLMDYCQQTKGGPIEGLKSFPRQSLSTDRTGLNNLVAQPGHNSPANSSHQMSGRGVPPSGSAQSAVTLSNYQNMLMRQKSMNSNSQQESPSVSNSNQNGSVQGWAMQNNRMIQQRPPPSQGGGQVAQQHMIQQIIQDMNNNNNSVGGDGGPKPSVSGQSNGSGSIRFGSITPAAGASPQPHTNGPAPAVPTRSNSFNSQKAPVFAQDIASEFTENSFFNNDDFEDTMGYGWKD
ncbi:LIM-domain binding protein/SEUSS [Artemisia annua]|uniref:LIM-domain binding protein/SEUSS n=1 Tax=Artemisia annua TaxID=35608 RepID=A0A2U1PRZ4_ARTAN|nr:LIM-domain binding protein/SEUSS [Artemisia annua]